MNDLSKKIAISVLTEYMPSHSSDEEGKYFFAYSVTIKNESDINVQLVSRHWKIANSNGNIKTVDGIGVIANNQSFILEIILLIPVRLK